MRHQEEDDAADVPNSHQPKETGRNHLDFSDIDSPEPLDPSQLTRKYRTSSPSVETFYDWDGDGLDSAELEEGSEERKEKEPKGKRTVGVSLSYV